jgi:hypothetical protein
MLLKNGMLFVKLPTSVHTDRVGHDTANPSMSPAPEGLGVGWTLHRVPSQRSAMAEGGKPPGPNTSATAVHAEGVGQETLPKPSPFPSVPDGVTGDCSVQVAPFHRSASSLVSVFPTAVQAEADVHDTAPKS